jgi:uncharacterized protein
MKLWPSKYNYHYKLNSSYTFINNFLTGALDFIKSRDWDLMLGGKFTEVDADPLSGLIERGYYYKDPDKEKKLFAELFKNFSIKANDRPVKYVICPTYACNLNCTYCFEKDTLSNNKKDMDESLLKASFESIKTISKKINKDIHSIELFGGEPLLPKNKDIVRKILEFAVEQNAKITIVTNGVFAGDFIDILGPAKDNIEMLQITIDGPESIHDKRRIHHSGKGSFLEISKSIDVLLDNKINTNARINVDMENIEYLPEIYDYMVKMDWIGHPNFKTRPSLITDHATLEYVHPVIEEEKLLEGLISIYDANPELEKLFGFYSFKPLRNILEVLNGAPNVSPRFFNCESNLLELYIFCPDGYIYTCPESIGNKNFSIGKFFPSFELSTKGMLMWKERDITNMEKCIDCKFAPICGGGCPFSSMTISGGKEPVCERYQEVLDTYLQHRGKQILESML